MVKPGREAVSKRFINSQKTLFFPIFLLFTIAIVYGTRIRELGFYWDDLANTFFAADGDALQVVKTVATARPALSILFYLPYRFLEANPKIWQIVNILCRWLMALFAYLFLQELLPGNRFNNQWVTLLFIIYPGFRQQWIARIYPPIFLVFTLQFLSLIIYIKAFRTQKSRSYGLHIISLLLSFYCLNASEYIFGLEFLRPIILLHEIRKQQPQHPWKKSLIPVFLRWLPYLLSLFIFIVLRTFFYRSSLYDVIRKGQILEYPIQALLQCSRFVFKSAWDSFFNVWDFLLTKDFFSSSSFRWAYLLPILICILYIFLSKLIENTNNSGNIKGANRIFLQLGLALVIFSGIPFWAAGLSPRTDFPNDRFFLSYAWGVSLLIFCLIDLFKRSSLLRGFIFLFVFSMGSIFHMIHAQSYVDAWDNFKDFTNQIAWRAPAFQDNTLLIAQELPLAYYSDNSLTGAINWLYAVEPVYPHLPIMLNYTAVRLGKSLPSLQPGTDVDQGYLLYSFSGSTDNMIPIFYQPPSCVHFALPAIDTLHPDLPQILREPAKLSNLSLISKDKQQNPLFFIDPMDNGNWCYYYQKASLALQYREFDQILALADEAFSSGFTPHDPSEAIPFIFAYSNKGQWDRAVQLSMINRTTFSQFSPMICAVWNIIDGETMDSYQKTTSLAKINTYLSCGSH